MCTGESHHGTRGRKAFYGAVERNGIWNSCRTADSEAEIVRVRTFRLSSSAMKAGN
jgi:hypothetical protein